MMQHNEPEQDYLSIWYVMFFRWIAGIVRLCYWQVNIKILSVFWLISMPKKPKAKHLYQTQNYMLQNYVNIKFLYK